MLVSYNGLFKQLIDKGWNKTEFAREVGICQRLDCPLGDIVQIVPHEPPAGDGIERAIKRSDERTKGGNVFRHE